MKNKFVSLLTVFSLLLGSLLQVNAQGIIVECTGNQNCPDTQRKLITYPVPNVNYRLDTDAILGVVNNPGDIVDETLPIWNNVPTSRVNFFNDGSIGQDVNGNNFNNFLGQAPGFTPVIFDANGDIFNAIFGEQFAVLGFAGPVFNGNGDIVDSQSAFSGPAFSFASPFRQNQNEAQIINDFRSTVLHEFGHAVGLDHTQIFNDDFQQGTNLNLIPIMFPVSANPGFDLKDDDIAAISDPPTYQAGNFANIFGEINGRVLNNNGQQIKGANVIAFNVADVEKAVSGPSNFDAKGQGNYEIPGVKGQYVLLVEPIDQDFVGGSSVGADGPPNNPNDVFPGFFNGDGQPLLNGISITQAFNQATKVDISAGEKVTINFEGNIGKLIAGDIGDDNGGGDNGGGDNGGGDNGGGDPPGVANLEFKGKVFNKEIRLKENKPRVVKFKIKKLVKGQELRFKLTSDLPENLVSFKPDTFTIKAKKNAKTVKINLASFNDFLQQIPGLAGFGLIIQITAEDLDNGGTVEQELRVF